MAYHFHILFPFVSTILHSTVATGHTARRKALTLLLQGFAFSTKPVYRAWDAASLSSLRRQVVAANAKKRIDS